MMTKYLADTNFFLRFILQDNQKQARIAEKRLTEAKEGKISIFFPDEVILEMEFVMRSFYRIDKDDIVKTLQSLLKMSYLEIENKVLWSKTLQVYEKRNISLIDIFLHHKARQMQAEVLSFDKDFKKLAKFLINFPCQQ